jgi:hypothetical protein
MIHARRDLMFWLHISTKTANTLSAPSNTKLAAKKTMQRHTSARAHALAAKNLLQVFKLPCPQSCQSTGE